MRAVVAAPAAAVVLAGMTACTPPPPVTFAGFGPLHVGMTEQQAVATGWLSARTQPWCTLGQNQDVAYALTGRGAPPAINGRVIFHAGRLDTVGISRGASTAQGVQPGHTPASDLDNAYPATAYDKVDLHVTGHHIVSVRPKGAAYPTQLQFLVDDNPFLSRVQQVGAPYVPLCG